MDYQDKWNLLKAKIKDAKFTSINDRDYNQARTFDWILDAMSDLESYTISTNTVKREYSKLYKYLKSQQEECEIITLSFEEIEKIIHSDLPKSAYNYSAWWSNNGETHSQAKSWLEAGWRTEKVKLGETISFRKKS